jgi:hypothetical protein
MVIYTSTLIFCFLFCYRSWIITSAPWISFCYVVTDHGYLHQHIDFLFVDILLSIVVIYPSTLILFLFCYRSWLFTPAPWFSFCCYFVIDHDYLHQDLDFLFVVILLSIMAIYTSTLILFFILLSIMVIYTSTLIFFLLLFCYRSWLFTPAPWCWFCFYFVIDHGYLPPGPWFWFFFILLSIKKTTKRKSRC